MNICGSCGLCCKFLDIPAIDKPANRWCPSWTPGQGCKIYESRPKTCETFHCMWLTTRVQSEAKPLPDDLRPDRCKALMMIKEGVDTPMACHVDPANPNAWREGTLGKFLRFMAKKTRIVVKSGRRVITLDADGAYEATIIGDNKSERHAIGIEKTDQNRIEW